MFAKRVYKHVVGELVVEGCCGESLVVMKGHTVLSRPSAARTRYQTMEELRQVEPEAVTVEGAVKIDVEVSINHVDSEAGCHLVKECVAHSQKLL